jgi:MGT family glycosyltransferase
MLVMVPKAFDRPAANLPGNVRYVGPVQDEEPNRPAWDLPWALDNPDPLVLVSFSTTYMGQEGALRRTLVALAGLQVRGLVTTGPSVNPSLLIPSSNTVVRSHIDHQAVLPHASAVVTHAGFGTVMAALTHGVPLLCLPMGRDQGANSEHVEACGAGRTIPPDATGEEIRAALSDVLESPRYGQGARRMAGIIKREANGSMVVPLLEGLLTRTSRRAAGV